MTLKQGNKWHQAPHHSFAFAVWSLRHTVRSDEVLVANWYNKQRLATVRSLLHIKKSQRRRSRVWSRSPERNLQLFGWSVNHKNAKNWQATASALVPNVNTFWFSSLIINWISSGFGLLVGQNIWRRHLGHFFVFVIYIFHYFLTFFRTINHLTEKINQQKVNNESNQQNTDFTKFLAVALYCYMSYYVILWLVGL